MLLPGSVKIYLATQPCDMRKGPDGLMSLVKHKLIEDPFSGQLFVFYSKRKNRIKCLFWQKGGFCIFYKRLEKGRFLLPRLDENSNSVQIEAADLAMLLSGIDLSNVRRQKLWQPKR